MITLGAYFGQLIAGNYRATLKQLRPGGGKGDGGPRMQLHPRIPPGHMPLPQPT